MKSDPSPKTDPQANNLYAAMGGSATCRKLSIAFYARVARDPILRPLFPGKTFTCAIEEFAAFLTQFLDGPGEEMQRRWWLSLRESHLRFKIGPEERQAWMANMMSALDDVSVAEPARTQLLGLFEHSSAYVVNQGRVQARGSMDPEISCRWEAQLRLDDTVAVIRSGDADRAIDLASRAHPAVASGLLALMLRSRHPILCDYVRATVTGDPALVQRRYAGRTLLHEAAAVGDLITVELLLKVGAGVDELDSGGHTPLYSVANECRLPGAGNVVHALVRSGANVNAHDGVQRCTPLHMAARRGSVEVAAALLECGADIDARDRQGDTPLRRAVNCDKLAVAALLAGRGADLQSIGSKGLTPRSAARTAAMKSLLAS